MKLTIGMIVKNEEKWLNKCLTAIKPILDNVDSELIITDTGSTDRTVEIAQKYTDKVLHFDWINDFSAARNYGLQKAHGEWFMMLDADDIFRSCDNIIDFFNSGEYRNYNAASYVSRNLVKTSDGDSYTDILAPRMVKLYPHTRYENSVHESLNTFDPPYKNLQDIADHYGYYYETEDEKIKKFNRNIGLLLERLETESETTPMLYVQLYEAYLGANNEEKALYYLNQGIELSRKLNSIVLIALYFHKASYYQTGKKYKDAIRICDEYFLVDRQIRPYPLTTDGEIYGIKAESLYSEQRYCDAIDSFKCYFETYKDIKSGKLVTYDSYLVSGYICSDLCVMPLYNDFIECCIKSGKLNTADSYLSTYPIYRYSYESSRISDLVKLIIQVSDNGFYGHINKYYKQLNELGRKMLSDELFYRLDKDAEKNNIRKMLIALSNEYKRIDMKYKIYDGYINYDDVFELIYDYSLQYGINEDVDLIYISLARQYDFTRILGLPGTDIKRCALLCCRNIENFFDIAEHYDGTSVRNIDLAIKFYEACISVKLIDNESKSNDEKEDIIRGLFNVKKKLIAEEKSSISEFEKLSIAVKNNIKRIIECGNYKAAKKSILEYQTINPNDPDIPDIYSKIENMSQETL